ncbi:MAG: NAD(P) transhydrogenase subunit alpha [Actinobacteria bacterium]|nr:NAD(P) transhydrogenase subunit alpha [Actinomycetota bacterium]
MINDSVTLMVIFVLSAFVGYEVISKVPSILHTPLMSGSNAIHGIILAGAMIVAGYAHGTLQTALAAVAVFLATGNIVGGAVVTDRMLGMFKGRQPGPSGGAGQRGTPQAGAPAPAQALGAVAPEKAATQNATTQKAAPGEVAGK